MEVCQDVADFVGLALPLELLAALPPVLCVLCTITEKNSNVEFSGFFFNWDFVRQLASRVAA